MNDDVHSEIAALRRMTATQLRRRHVELFGEECRSGNRRYLFRRLAWRLQAVAEGDLSQRARLRARQLARDADLRRRAPRDVKEPAQADSAGPPPPRDPRLPRPGTVIRRSYKGHDHLVTVLARGFEYDGSRYRSLSAVAHAITGSHWNGWLFFGFETPVRSSTKDSAP